MKCLPRSLTSKKNHNFWIKDFYYNPTSVEMLKLFTFIFIRLWVNAFFYIVKGFYLEK